jgi:hypothetical protein
LGDAFPERRVEEIILSGSPDVWKELAPILAKDPNGAKVLGGALRSVISEKVAPGGKVRSMPDIVGIFRKDIYPALEQAGMTKQQIGILQAQIDAIGRTAPEAEKLNRVVKIIVQALGGEAGRGLGAAATAINPFGVTGVAK